MQCNVCSRRSSDIVSDNLSEHVFSQLCGHVKHVECRYIFLAYLLTFVSMELPEPLTPKRHTESTSKLAI